MLPGPVFNVELVTSSRRPRYYALRVVYGLVLLVLVWQNYAQWDRFGGTEFAPQQMTEFARSTFTTILILQGAGVLAMTPSLCAGVIANEKQRKTLHYLLVSTLSSGEIVLGKLLARMLQVVVFLAIGLPVMCLLSLFGGVDPLFAVLATVGSLSVAFALACLAVLCSTLSKRVREAITMTYILEGAWLFLPLLAQGALPMYYPELYGWLRPLNDWLYASTPWAPLRTSFFVVRTSLSWPLIETTLWMSGLQIGAGIVFVSLSVWRLRPVFKAQEGTIGRRFLGIPLPGRKTGRIRLFGRRSPGEKAMIWKELFTSRTSGAAQVAAILMSVLIAGLIGYWTYVFASEAITELWSNPYDTFENPYQSWHIYTGGRRRSEFSHFLRILVTAIEFVCILAAAVGAANTFTSEREDDTWISLISTPLPGREIVAAKILGVFWKLRWAVALVVAEWITGALCGAIHPMGVLFQLVVFAVFLTFTTALGTYVSLISKSTWRSQATTVGVLIMSGGGGYLLCCVPMLWGGPGATVLYASGCMPLILGASLVTPWEFAAIFVRHQTTTFGSGGGNLDLVLTCFVGTVFYAVLAFTLLVLAFTGFDKAADRPYRDHAPAPVRPKQKSAPEVG